MRKAVLFTAVVVVAAVGALLWYVGAKAAEPEHIEVSVGASIDWTIPTDPDCNDEDMVITINYERENNGLKVVGANQVIGEVELGPNDYDRLPTYIYVDVQSKVAGQCESWRWWQINVTVPPSELKRGFVSKNDHNALPEDTPPPPTPTPAPTPYATLPDGASAGCSYYHDHGSNGPGSWGSTDCLDKEFATELNDMYKELGYEELGKKTSKNTYYHNHYDTSDNGGVEHSGGVSHNDNSD